MTSTWRNPPQRLADKSEDDLAPCAARIGEESEYEEVAKEIWKTWQAHKSKPE